MLKFAYDVFIKNIRRLPVRLLCEDNVVLMQIIYTKQNTHLNEHLQHVQIDVLTQSLFILVSFSVGSTECCLLSGMWHVLHSGLLFKLLISNEES
jgi:hypothetical protein